MGLYGLTLLKQALGSSCKFFLGAYEALTHYFGYQGVGFLFLQDLSKADSLFWACPHAIYYDLGKHPLCCLL